MDLLADFLHFGASDFPSKNPFKKCFKIVFFSLWRRDPVLELQFPTPLCVVLLCFLNSVSADRIVMAASRLLRAVAAFVILLSFAARLRKSYWSGCMKAATVDLLADFLHFGASDFPSKNPFKKCFKIVLHNNSTWVDVERVGRRSFLKSASKSSCTTTVRGWTTKSRTTKFSADNTVISGKLCGPFNQSLLMLR